MGNIFAITTVAEDIKADAAGEASAIFTVTNTSHKAVRGIARARALGGTQQGWLDVEGETEKDFEAGGTQQFTAIFSKPVTPAAPGAPPPPTEKFPFRLDVASAANPDELFTEGPTVKVETTSPAAAPAKKGFPLWIIIVIAAAALLIGGLYLFLVRRPDNPTQRTQENKPIENKPIENKPVENKLVTLDLGTQITSPGFSNGEEKLIYIGTDTRIYSNAQTADSTWLGGAPLVIGQAKSICSAINIEGEVEIFYIGPGTDDLVYHNVQRNPPSHSWFGENRLGGAGKSITCGKNFDGRLEIFYAGTDNGIYHHWQLPGGGWSREDQLEGTAREITVGSNRDGRLEIFYVGMNYEIYHSWQTVAGGGWSREDRFSERQIGQIVAISDGNGELNIFYTGRGDNNIYRDLSIGGRWQSETTLPGKAKQITAAVGSDGRIEVFYIGLDDEIYHDLQADKNSDNWNGEMAMGGQAKQIISIGNQNGRLEIFYVKMDNGLFHNWKKADGSWSGEKPVTTPR